MIFREAIRDVLINKLFLYISFWPTHFSFLSKAYNNDLKKTKTFAIKLIYKEKFDLSQKNWNI